MLQRERVRLWVEGGHAVHGHVDCVVSISRVGRRVHYANVGAYPADDDLFWAQSSQPLAEIRIVEGAVPALGNYLSLVLL